MPAAERLLLCCDDEDDGRRVPYLCAAVQEGDHEQKDLCQEVVERGPCWTARQDEEAGA